jgi:hypothetical protein
MPEPSMRTPFVLGSTALYLFGFSTAYCFGQTFTAPAPDGTPGIAISQGCLSSRFFEFTYRLPEGMSLSDMSEEPNGGKDPTGRGFVLFKAYKANDKNRDVVDAAAEDRRSAKDSSAASWIRALHRWNATRADVPKQDDVESTKLGAQEFSRLRFQQSRDDGVITYEAAYAIGVRGYVIFFILGSVDQRGLTALEESMKSLSTGNGACSTAK